MITKVVVAALVGALAGSALAIGNRSGWLDAWSSRALSSPTSAPDLEFLWQLRRHRHR
jgi:hypothetical protein